MLGYNLIYNIRETKVRALKLNKLFGFLVSSRKGSQKINYGNLTFVVQFTFFALDQINKMSIQKKGLFLSNFRPTCSNKADYCPRGGRPYISHIGM